MEDTGSYIIEKNNLMMRYKAEGRFLMDPTCCSGVGWTRLVAVAWDGPDLSQWRGMVLTRLVAGAWDGTAAVSSVS